MSDRSTELSAVALASFEAFVQTLSGSSAQARRALGAARERAMRWRAEGRWPERGDRELLFRALGEHPALADASGGETSTRARPPRSLASLPMRLRLPWALRECAAWTPAEIAWLLDCPRRVVHDALDDAETALSRQIASDVLVVGRQPLVLRALSQLLAEAGHTVVGTAATRTRAIVLARESPPALVVADLEGPLFASENEAVRALGSRLDVPFVLLCSTPVRGASLEELPAGHHVLGKPYDPDALTRTCLRALLFRHVLASPEPVRAVR